MFKLKFMFIIILVLMILILGKVPSKTYASEFPLLGKVIYVDAGHGGRDPGVIYGNIYEKDINLEISKRLEEELSLMGAMVFLTREEDIDYSSKYDVRKKRGDLYRRIKMIDGNAPKTDLYLSIHINWYDNGKFKGAEVLYYNSKDSNKLLAEKILASLKRDTGTTRDIRTTNLYMYKYITTPGVLIECGFLSNYQERNLLQSEDYQVKLAKSITNGVIDYFQNS